MFLFFKDERNSVTSDTMLTKFSDRMWQLNFHKITIVIILSVSVEIYCDNDKLNRVTVYKQTGFDGPRKDFNISSCVPTLEPEWDLAISGVHSNDNCVQLYEEQHCTGKYLALRSGSGNHDNIGYYSFSKKTRSLGPCFELCHPERIPGKDLKETTVYIYDNPPRNNESPVDSLTVKFAECVDISRSRKIPYSFRAKIPSLTCVEFHSNGDCTGEFMTLSMGSHSQRKDTNYFMDRSKHRSVSFCGYNCNHSYANEEEVDVEEIEDLHAILFFRSIDFNGEKFPLQISAKKCVNLPSGWNGDTAPLSVITFGKCVEFFATKSCEEESLIEAVIGESPFLFGHAESLRLCDIEGSPSSFDYFWIITISLLALTVLIIVGVLLCKRKIDRERNEQSAVSYSNGMRNGESQRSSDHMHHRLIDVDSGN